MSTGGGLEGELVRLMGALDRWHYTLHESDAVGEDEVSSHMLFRAQVQTALVEVVRRVMATQPPRVDKPPLGPIKKLDTNTEQATLVVLLQEAVILDYWCYYWYGPADHGASAVSAAYEAAMKAGVKLGGAPAIVLTRTMADQIHHGFHGEG